MIVSPGGLPMLEGTDPISFIDDWSQQLVVTLDSIAVGSKVSFTLGWTGDVLLDITYQAPPYLTFSDETNGIGIVPVYDPTEGIEVPTAGVYTVQAVHRLTNGPDVSSVSTRINRSGTVLHEETGDLARASGDYLVAASVTCWLEAGETVRSDATAFAGTPSLTSAAIRLAGPM